MNETRHIRAPCSDGGFVLHTAFVLLLLVAAAAGLFLYSARQHSAFIRRSQALDQCLLDAQSALERVKYEIVQSYLASQDSAAGSFRWFETWSVNSIGSDPVYNLPSLMPINDSSVAVTIAGVAIFSDAGYAEVELIGAAARSAPFVIRRMIQETLRVSFGSGGGGSDVFDYAYFIDGNGRMEGDRRVINGDMRANGEFSFQNNPEVNGNVYASGSIIGGVRNWTQRSYWVRTMRSARPTDPADAAGNHAWPMGYDAENATRNSSVAPTAMPGIGDIEELARSAKGTISQGGVNLVVNVYDGAGPDGVAGTADDGTLVLIGTSAARPVHINGLVVVKGDLIIRGHVTGQGTVYTGRNIHIVGGLSYSDPPEWPKTRDAGDLDPHQTADSNSSKDLLVLASSGNIVVGNYTTPSWSNRVWNIMADSGNIKARNVSEYDAAIGYDSDDDPSTGYLFDGRYYLHEAHGGTRLSGEGTNTVPRRYYESSLADSTFNSFCSPHVHVINAALFSNHAIIGDIGSSAPAGNTIINGAMVCRNDLHNYYGAFTLNWDIRLGSRSFDRINSFFGTVSTGTVAQAATTGWREIH